MEGSVPFNLKMKRSAKLFAAAPTYAHDPVEHVLMDYEDASKALSKDDLAWAKRAATKLATNAKKANQTAIAEHAQAIAKSPPLEGARTHFMAGSRDAEKLAQGRQGYYVLTCLMEKADWVQTTKGVANPYLGQQMPTCGQIKQP